VGEIARYFGVTIDQLVNYENQALPEEVSVQDKRLTEQVKLIAQLEEEDQHTVFKMIDTFLTKKKFKDFFNNNLAAL
jgi:hypothetical protein